MLKSHGVEAESDRASWEDRLMGRQHALETAAAEARGLWHKLEAQVEQVQAYCAERALRTEHDELRAAVDALAASAATKRELGATNDITQLNHRHTLHWEPDRYHWVRFHNRARSRHWRRRPMG